MKPSPPPSLLITIDSMRHANTGLHTFGSGLCPELFPSLAEGFGLPIIEAMHHGNFEPEHMARVFADGMARFAAHDGAAAARLHASQYTWAKAAASYLALFQKTMA